MRPYPSLLRRMVQAGVLGYPVLVLVLWYWVPLPFWGAAYLALLLELLPLLGLAQLPLADDEGSFPRIPVYLTSGAVILLLGWAGLVIGTGVLGREAMGLGGVGWVSLLLWTVGTTLAVMGLQLAFLLGRLRLGIGESPLLGQLLPRTYPERVVFFFLSLAAGLGEEIPYRAFAIPVLAALTGSDWAAALASSLAFGALHGYQGWLGVGRTAAMGFLLSASFLLSGSLWPAILAHALLDLVSGLVLGETLLRKV